MLSVCILQYHNLIFKLFCPDEVLCDPNNSHLPSDEDEDDDEAVETPKEPVSIVCSIRVYSKKMVCRNIVWPVAFAND